VSLVGVDDCEGSGNRLSEIVSTSTLLASRSLHCASCAAIFLWIFCEKMGCPYILVNLLEPPPAIFCTLKEPNSVLRSSSCLFKSSLFFPQRSLVLTRAVFDCHVRQHSSRERRFRSYHLNGSCWVKISESRLREVVNSSVCESKTADFPAHTPNLGGGGDSRPNIV